MTVEERLREWIEHVERCYDSWGESPVPDNCYGTLCLGRARELLAELTAKDAQIAKLRAVAEAERELQESCGGPLPADFDVVAFLVSRGWKYNGP